MNIISTFFIRTFQTLMCIVSKNIKLRTPEVLKNNDALINVLKEKHIDKVLIITNSDLMKFKLLDDLLSNLKNNHIEYALYDGVVPNPTIDNVNECVDLYKNAHSKALIAFGGGSVMDASKITGAVISNPHTPITKMRGLLKIKKPIPLLITVPTTAGTGSETTIAAVINDSKNHDKFAINDPKLIPHYVYFDPKLLFNLPSSLTSSTGMDALCHAIEAYIGRASTKKSRKESLEAIDLIFNNLELSYANPKEYQYRYNMQVAAYKAGLAFTRAYIGYVHAVAHALGGRYGTPHGYANAIILPRMLELYGKKAYQKLAKISDYTHLCSKDETKEIKAKTVIEKIKTMNKTMNIVNNFHDVIIDKDISSLAKHAAKEANPLYPCPKVLSKKQIESFIVALKEKEE